MVRPLLAMSLCFVLAGVALGQAPAGRDAFGDTLPPGAVARIGTTRLWHRNPEGPVAIAYLPDGKSFITVAGPGLRFWDSTTGQLLRELKFDEAIAAFAVAPDGKRFATSHVLLNNKIYEYQVRTWETASGKEEKRFKVETDYKVASLVFSPDGTELAGLDEIRVHRWQMPDGKALAPRNVRGGATAFAYSLDGKQFALGGSHAKVHVVDSATEKELFTLQGKIPIQALAFSPDGQRLASLSKNFTAINEWDLATQKLLRESNGAQQTALIAYSRSGTLAAVDKSIMAMQFSDVDGKIRRTVSHPTIVSSFAVSPDGKTLATFYGDGCVRLWDPATAAEKGLQTHRQHIRRLEFLTGDQSVVTAADDGTVRTWNAANGKQIRQLPAQFETRQPMALSANGRYLGWAEPKDNAVAIWNVETGKAVAKISGAPSTLALSDDGATVALAFNGFNHRMGAGEIDYSRIVKVVNVASGKVHFTNQAHRTAPEGGIGGFGGIRQERGADSLVPVTSMAFSPDGAVLASDAIRDVALVDVRAGRLLRAGIGPVRVRSEVKDKKTALPLSFRHWSPPSTVRSSADGQLLLILREAAPLQVFERATGAEVQAVDTPDDVTAFAISPRCRLLVLAHADGVIRLWDLAQKRTLGEMKTGTPITALTFSSNGKLLASGHEDGSALIWDSAALEAKTALPTTLESSWTNLLGANAALADDAIRALSADPGAVEFLKARLKPARKAEPEKDAPTEEAKLLDGETLRVVRAIRVLERIGTPGAAAVLRELTAGPGTARETIEARDALHRLAR